MTASLEETREQARAEVDRLDRLIEIKEFLTQKLTNERGEVIDAQLEFELGGLKVSIKKARVRNARSENKTPEGKSSKRGKRKSKRAEPKQLKASDIKKIDALSFNGLKKREAVQAIQAVVPSFDNSYWDSFRESFEKKLTGEGRGAGRQWTFNV